MSHADYWLLDDGEDHDWDGPPVGPIRAKVNAVIGVGLAALWLGWLIAGLAIHDGLVGLWSGLKVVVGPENRRHAFDWIKAGLWPNK